MAVFVVAIHTHPFERCGCLSFKNAWDVLIGVAVPYFFIASGFFLFLKLKEEKKEESQLKKIKSYTKRIVELYVFWTIIYFPVTIWYFFNNDNPFYTDILSFIKGFFFRGENYYSWHLWYLLSMIYSLILLCILKRNSIKNRYVFIISITINRLKFQTVGFV